MDSMSYFKKWRKRKTKKRKRRKRPSVRETRVELRGVRGRSGG